MRTIVYLERADLAAAASVAQHALTHPLRPLATQTETLIEFAQKMTALTLLDVAFKEVPRGDAE